MRSGLMIVPQQKKSHMIVQRQSRSISATLLLSRLSIKCILNERWFLKHWRWKHSDSSFAMKTWFCLIEERSDSFGHRLGKFSGRQ